MRAKARQASVRSPQTVLGCRVLHCYEYILVLVAVTRKVNECLVLFTWYQGMFCGSYKA